MDWTVVAALSAGMLVLVIAAVLAGELSARLFLEASESLRERESTR